MRTIYRFVDFINRYSKKYLLLKLLLFIFLYRILYFFLYPHKILYNSDSVTYFIPVDLFHGKIDLYRTLVYPYLIKFFKYVTGDYFLSGIIYFQQILSFLSIIPFYYVLKQNVQNRTLIVLSVLFYGCFPLIINQNININPESLCIVGSVVFMYFLSVYIHKPTRIYAFVVGILPLFLIMLKPVYLIALLICFLFFFAKLFVRSEQKTTLWGVLGILVSIAGVWGYSEMNRKNNGEFTLSKISMVNIFLNVIISDAYKSGGDEEFINIIDETKSGGPYVPMFTINKEWSDMYKASYARFPQYLAPTGDMNYNMSMNAPVFYPASRIQSFIHQSQFSKTYIFYMAKQTVKLFFSFQLLSLILILELILIIWNLIKHRKIAWFLSFCVLFVTGQCFTIALGSIDGVTGWVRLFLPSFPFIILLFAIFLQQIVLSIDKESFNKMLNYLR